MRYGSKVALDESNNVIKLRGSVSRDNFSTTKVCNWDRHVRRMAKSELWRH